MVDTVDKETRSRIMSRVRGKDTVPEMIVRRLVFSLGYRYRLHDSNLPGRPDMVFAGRKKVILVHGCFWHRHDGCVQARLPKSNKGYWVRKLSGNKERDIKNLAALRALGWDILVIWECDLADQVALRHHVVQFLEDADGEIQP